jgi:catalase
VRDTRGSPSSSPTRNFDLVGNIPVFFIQDGLKFPDIIHAAKPFDREIPQARSAHDTFWDFVSLHTEATHRALEHERPRHSAFLPDDGGLRRPPSGGQRRRRDHL